MAVKGQDVVVMLKLLSQSGDSWTYQRLAHELGMSSSEVHTAVKRCENAGLYNSHTRQPNRSALKEFLVHGLRYVFPAKPGPLVQGLPTSYAGPVLAGKVGFDSNELPVMPLLHGPARGPEISPLHHAAPAAAQSDPKLYDYLSLVDALRTGRARERKLAVEALDRMMASV
jgi:hypothetical protein